MISYIAQRLAGMIIVMFLVVSIVFVIVRVTPGDPASVMLGPEATQQDLTDLRNRLGLDRSIFIQYVFYFGRSNNSKNPCQIFSSQNDRYPLSLP